MAESISWFNQEQDIHSAKVDVYEMSATAINDQNAKSTTIISTPDENKTNQMVTEVTGNISNFVSYTIDGTSDGIEHGIDKDNCEVFYILPNHKCNICYEIFNIVDHLSDHIAEMHLKTPPYKDQCLLCGELFDVPIMLVSHMNAVHNSNNPYRCKYCARRFSNRDQLSTHTKYLHDNLSNQYECNICGRSYSTLLNLQNHKAEQHKKLLNCPYCVKCFDKSSELKHHLNVHVYPERIFDSKPHDFDIITLEDTHTRNNIKIENHDNTMIDEKFCYICGKDMMNGSENFNEHLYTHSNERFFECPDCHSLFEEFYEFIGHMKDHTKVKITNTNSENTETVYVPKVNCGFTTRPQTPTPTTEQDAETAVENETNKIPEKLCIVCQKIFRNNEDYDQHIKKHNNTMILRNAGPLGTITWRNKLQKSYQFYCKFCKRYFVLGTTLLLHNKKVHKTLKPHKCVVCSMAFAQSSELRKHSEQHPDVKQFACKSCDMKFSKRVNLRYHKFHHKGSQHKCYYCGSDCSNQAGLEKHIVKHIGDTVQYCEFCEVPFTHIADLNLHVSRVHNVNPQLWQCRICLKAYNSALEIMQHNRINHAGEKPYKCEECGKSFALLHSLVNHKVIHSGRKDYKCEYCNKGFSYASYLKMHIRTHTGERPYCCPFCPKTFARQANLYEHKKQHIFDTPTPYTCEICGKAYVTLSSFNKHKLLHTGIKSFKCDVCSRAYVQKTHLTIHMYSHSSVRAFECSVCGKKFKSPAVLSRHERKIHCVYKSKRKIAQMIKNTTKGESSEVAKEQKNQATGDEKDNAANDVNNEDDDDDDDDDFEELSEDDEEEEEEEEENEEDDEEAAMNQELGNAMRYLAEFD